MIFLYFFAFLLSNCIDISMSIKCYQGVDTWDPTVPESRNISLRDCPASSNCCFILNLLPGSVYGCYADCPGPKYKDQICGPLFVGPVKQEARCSNTGGMCMDVALCDKSNGTVTSGLCPTQGRNIKCCFQNSANTNSNRVLAFTAPKVTSWCYCSNNENLCVPFYMVNLNTTSNAMAVQNVPSG